MEAEAEVEAIEEVEASTTTTPTIKTISSNLLQVMIQQLVNILSIKDIVYGRHVSHKNKQGQC